MEITVLGAARQVGRSALLVKNNSTRLIVDFGVLMAKEPAFPIHVQPKDVQGVVLSHAHLDHTGAAPLFYLGKGVPLYATPLTAELSSLLIEDFLRISGFYLPFEYLDLLSMMKQLSGARLSEPIRVGDFNLTFYEAGHIPGSSMVLLESGGKRVLYTGDVNGEATQLLNPLFKDYGELDLVVTESTYATADHPPRAEVERDFVAYAREVVERGGTLFVPAFSVARSQELACVLKAADFPYTVAMDGMALKTNQILTKYPEYIRDPQHLRRSLDDLELITSWDARKRIAQTPSVIISPAGMLVGGASTYYNSQVAVRSKNGIAIVSYQAAGTPGRTLLDKGLALVNGRPVRVKAEIRRFDFSSHSGKSQLLDMVGSFKGNPKVITVHGEEASCLEFASTIREKFGFESFSPTAGETYNL